MLSIYSSVISGRSAWYCSAPITTGRRNIDWLESIGSSLAEIDEATDAVRAEHSTRVVALNIQHAKTVVDRLRRARHEIVIDPTGVPPQHDWTQHDWRSFWGAVIERHVSTVLLVEGWEFSNGCAFEFWVASSSGLVTLHEDLTELTVSDGVRMIRSAIDHISGRAGSTAFLNDVVSRLEQIDQMKAVPR